MHCSFVYMHIVWVYPRFCQNNEVENDSTLRKHAYSNILKILPPKNEIFQMKNSDIFHISAQNIDCGYSLEPPRRGGSNEYPQSMFLSRNKKNNVYPCKPSFTIEKWGLRGSKLYRHVFVMNWLIWRDNMGKNWSWSHFQSNMRT